MSARRERSWVELDAVAPLAGRVTDNHTHLPVAGLGDTGPGSDAPLDAAALVTRAASVGVARLITSACELPTWSGTLDMARSLRPVRAALGFHPNEAVLHAGILETGPDGLEHVPGPHHEIPLDEAMGLLETAIRSHRELVVAVGETGMDLFRTGSRGAVAQREAFRAHIALAKELDLPLQIHDRDAHTQCVEILLADGAPARTVFHCFSGGSALAAACAEHGWYASVAGPLTYPSNRGLREALALLPDELLLVETDAPYLPPVPWRGRPNASYLIPATVRFLAAQRGLDEEQTCQRLEATTTQVYGTW